MARRGEPRRLRQGERRTSWTRFYLPPGQDWPEWPTDYPDRYLGPLADVADRNYVYLGRQVDDPTKAVFIVFWESADELSYFQHTPACGEFLRGLGCENKSLLSLQYDTGAFFEGHLLGRVTLNILTIPYTGVPDRKTWSNSIQHAFQGFMPKGGGKPGIPHIFRWKTSAWVDDGHQEQSAPVEIGPRHATYYLFYCWVGQTTSAVEEEISAKDPESHGLWAARVARVMPPVEAWEQERWDIKRAPLNTDPASGDDGDEDMDFVDDLELMGID
ncbi:hypothetical protein FHL15_009432 [Xylaria flabelliformis]|uniref:ABM domain-containing protein n=1 Tax=Xylaria flabelliformis TaxID=2512241 RepID=A0A553HNZ7_9PEZI|nr:hypothetical protein FHL15_009432 [Xylaria flabelliformis]